MTVARYIRTILGVRPSQLYWRLNNRLRCALEERLGRVPSWMNRHPMASIRVDHVKSIKCLGWNPRPLERHAAELTNGSLTLVGRELPFSGGNDWRVWGDRLSDRLWTYTLHYHGWMCDLAVEFTQGRSDSGLLILRFLKDWIRRCRPGDQGFSHFAWNSYAIATRLLSWARLVYLLPVSFWSNECELLGDMGRSAAVQAEYLRCHLEWDLRGNHLIRDAVGLAVAGAMLDHPSGPRWVREAECLVVDQLDEQVLKDGGHFERSPMYHAQCTADIFLLNGLLETLGVAHAFPRHLERMASVLDWLRHPDGSIALLNDSALNGECDATPIVTHLLHAGPDSTAKRATGLKVLDRWGLAIIHDTPWSVFFDGGPIGASCQPGHGHADALTVEASVHGRRFLVDPGTYGYDRDERRRYDRSTESHNTVSIDFLDSSEVWDVFRVGRRAECSTIRTLQNSGETLLVARHFGYRHLRGEPIHERACLLLSDGRLRVTDKVTGSGIHHVSGGWLLHPSWSLAGGNDSLLATDGPRRVKIIIRGPVKLEVQRRPYHPRFGEEVETNRVCWHAPAGRLPIEVTSEFIPAGNGQ